MKEGIISNKITLGIRGFFKMEAVSVQTDWDGNFILDRQGHVIPLEHTRRPLVDWFPNKLLDSGKNRMGGYSDWLSCCQVGTNNTAPSASDTGLLGYVGGTSNIDSNVIGAQSSAPYYGWRQITYRFGVGDTAANLSEVGVGWSVSSGAYLLTRALIVDGTGSPTTVTPLADEVLDVTYQLRYYPPTGDVTGQLTLNSVLYNYTLRAASVTSSSAWGNIIGQEIRAYTGQTLWPVYDSNIGTITQDPSGTTADPDSDSQGSIAYSNNSYQRKVYSPCAPSGWVLGTGIRSFLIPTYGGRYQMEVEAASGGATIPKTVSFTMHMQWIIGWTEEVIP